MGVITAKSQNGDFLGLETLFDRMQQLGLEPDVVTFNSLINAKAQRGDFLGVENLFDRMQQLGLEPNEVTFNSVITAKAKRGDFVGVESLYDRMRDYIIHALQKYGSADSFELTAKDAIICCR